MVASWSFLAAAGRAGEHFLKTRLRLPLPAADLVRMYFVLGRDRLDRAVPAQRFGRYLGFELRCESASFRRHPLGPPHGLVYTLTSCPFFRDHLNMPAACSINSRWRCGCSSGAADNGPGDSSANGSSRDDSGASEAVCSDSDGATTGTGTDAGRSVGGRSCGAESSSDDGAAGMGAQEGAGNSEACPFNSGRGSRAPSCPAPGSCATPCLATGTTGAFIAAASPEHCSAGGASSGADRGPRSPCSPASPGAAGSPSCLVRPAES